jgi:Sec-independent protein translocase protein TatA
MPHINSLELVLATLAVIAIFGPKRFPKRGAKREPEMVDLTALVEREREVLRPDFGQEPEARRSEAGAPRAIRIPIEHRELIKR